ncbi:MAG: hypothetical protein ACP5KN_09345, partial [Armatimonadota bacterium]
YDQNWAQYPRSVAADDQGWIYFGVGNTACQILTLNRETGEAAPVIPEDERVHGMASVYRDLNGKVYGRSPAGQWYELYAGQATEIDEPAERNPKPIITGSQGLFHRQFPTGERLAYLDLVNRKLGVETADGETRVLEFDYPSEGAHIMGLAAASDNTICGGSAFPMRFFSYDPATDEWVDRNALGQWNTIAPTEDLFYIGAYTHGLLQVWDPSREWVPTERDNENSNPRLLAEAGSVINRPHDLLAHPDGRHVIMAGTPGYGLTGGGLLIYDMQTDEETLLTHEELLQWQSTMSLVALPDGKLLGGTTVAAGTGGERKAEQAELYIFDMETNQIEWHEPLLPGTGNYTDMILGPDGLVFGFANRSVFFVLDPQAREIVHQEDVSEQFGSTTSGQGPRVFVQSPDGRIFILFVSGIAELDPGSYGIEMLAESPVGIAPGGDWLDGRIYFGHGSHVYSWEVPAGE